MQKILKPLSKLNNEKVKLYRSSDLENTAIYWSDKNSGSAFLELLLYPYDWGKHEVYLRYPGELAFVEMSGGGMSSAHGNMKHGKGENIWLDYGGEFETYYQDSNLLYKQGLMDFNFMTEVTLEPEMEAALARNYLQLPADIQTINYMYKTEGINPIFIVVHLCTYHFGPDSEKLCMIENNKATYYPVDEYIQYRDGGTTIIKFKNSQGEESELFFPTPFKKDGITTLNKETIVEVGDSEKERIIKFLELEVEPEKKED